MGILYKAIPKTIFPRHTPLFALPPSAPLRRSGESRNPEDTFSLSPGFRRGDEGDAGVTRGALLRKQVSILWIPAFAGMTTGWDL